MLRCNALPGELTNIDDNFRHVTLANVGHSRALTISRTCASKQEKDLAYIKRVLVWLLLASASFSDPPRRGHEKEFNGCLGEISLKESL